jgi:beta-glucosidase-like glycosyl hydrolase/CubicO group peptidase (beta-lactamase class C family)
VWASWSPAPIKKVKTVSSDEFKEVVTDDVSNKWVDETIAKMSLREKIGQFFMIAAYSNKSESHFRHIDSLVEKHKIGGLIFFQGQRENLKVAIDRFQGKADVPLLVAMDAEWGTSMRLFGEERFPYNYTIGAANDPKLTEKIGAMMGQECREMGIHMNFAPVADVNSNPNNPVIGFRSFGENPKYVSDHVAAAVRGMEGQSVLTSIKHFPGHGDTDVDSHKDLPVVNNTYKHINAVDFYPFKRGVNAGASSVMIGHLNVPALDDSGTPSSLSKKTIHQYLKGELGFKGLVISDALGMKAVADRYGKTEVVVKAFEAGCDILLFPESVVDAIDAIEGYVIDGRLDEDEINARCKKVLLAKYKSIIAPKPLKKYTASEQELARKQLFEKAITVLKNENDLFPIQRFDQKIAVVSVGSHTGDLKRSMDKVSEVDHFHYYSGAEAIRKFKSKIDDYDLVITTLHAKSVRPRNNYGLSKQWRQWVSTVSSAKKSAVVLFGNPLAFKKDIDLTPIDAVVIGYENHHLMVDRMGQFLTGTVAAEGRLPITVNADFKDRHGLQVKWGGRLKYSQPEEVGIVPDKLNRIDEIVENSIKAKAFPGCQIVVAVKGNIIYQKSFGHHTYDKKIAVKNDDVYDIASITKIAASTLSIMKLNSEGKINLEQRLNDHIPEVMGNSALKNIKLRHMMSHQAGLKPWIPFYTKTLDDKELSHLYYATAPSDSFNVQVAEGLWIRGSYETQMYDEILSSTLGARKYKYSDLGYYFLKRIIEKKTGKSLDTYVTETFYKPMGLKHLRYKPLEHFKKERIAPTEDDKIFRKQLIHGYVHDQGASMMGGVGGHAGLFSNATDLASLMQMFLNKGTYGGYRYISEQVVEEYTDCQYCDKNRRGAGFDKPTRNRKGGPSSNKASLESFGHSGFTGTLAWADPKYDITYVFLSNRVYPDAENWKIVKMSIRTEIQDVIYDALNISK